MVEIFNEEEFKIYVEDFEKFKQYINFQWRWGDLDWGNVPKDFLIYEIEKSLKFRLRRILPYIDPYQLKTVVDVGSGVGLIDILLSQYATDACFFLVDRSQILLPRKNQFFSESIDVNYHGFYNSWDVTQDIINSTQIDVDRFYFLDPTTIWPNDIDLVISTYSWCYHYPKIFYWDKVMTNLKVGGILILTVSQHINNQNIVKEISQDLACYPMSIFEDPATPCVWYVWKKML
jgi:SAM-dependent methyltransferase